MDIQELFSRDPLTLTRDDISTLVQRMRESRHLFNAGNMKAGSTKPKTEKQKQVASLSEKLKIDL